MANGDRQARRKPFGIWRWLGSLREKSEARPVLPVSL